MAGYKCNTCGYVIKKVLSLKENRKIKEKKCIGKCDFEKRKEDEDVV
jgi:Zn ribbon nucleic-acid-binding protein